MTKTPSRLLLPTVLAAPALLAFALPETRLELRAEEGATITRTFETTAELTLDNMDMTMNGQAPPMMPEMDMTMTTKATIVVTDEIQKVADGRATRFQRNFDTLSQETEMQMEIDMMGQTQSNEMSMPAASELEGKTVAFEWADGVYQAKWPEDSKYDEALLEGLVGDMDLAVFLPKGPVEQGDEWKVNPKELIPVMAPGGNLKLIPENVEAADMMGMQSNFGSSADWFQENLDGDVTVSFQGTRENDGGTLAVLSVRFDLENAVDMTEMVQEGMEKVELPPEAEGLEIEHMDLEIAYEGEGQILWDIAAGRAHSMDLSGDFSLIVDYGMSMSAQGMDLNIESTIEMSGSLGQTARFE